MPTAPEEAGADAPGSRSRRNPRDGGADPRPQEPGELPTPERIEAVDLELDGAACDGRAHLRPQHDRRPSLDLGIGQHERRRGNVAHEQREPVCPAWRPGLRGDRGDVTPRPEPPPDGVTAPETIARLGGEPNGEGRRARVRQRQAHVALALDVEVVHVDHVDALRRERASSCRVVSQWQSDTDVVCARGPYLKSVVVRLSRARRANVEHVAGRRRRAPA